MSAVGELTVAQAARIMREAVKDQDRERYIATTGLGVDVERFLVYFRTERGKREETIKLYEYCLARLAFFIHRARPWNKPPLAGGEGSSE